MGTNFDGQEINDNTTRIIPRAICDIFSAIDQKANYDFSVNASFMELYNEQLYDLLAPVRSNVDIREEDKVIKIPGLTEVPVVNFQETVKCLTQGSMGRATGATAMNAESSRSHAIFTLTVHQQEKNVDSATSAKFRLVDLAGSERPKKTQATGDRFKEGVSINKGLVALGNVISALGGEQRRGYINYRDSKLTRLLQDSLGGNSLTLMIACVSPADYNLEETLSTLIYADRACNIKNKPIVNVDAKVAEINKLKQEVQQNGNGFNYHESLKLKEENELLATENHKLTQTLNDMVNENTNLVERARLAETARDRMNIKLCELQAQYGTAVENLNQTVDPNTCPASFYEQLQTLKDLQADQKRAEIEIRNHEISNNNRSEGPRNEIDYDGKPHSPHHKDLDEHHEAYTLRPAALSKELQDALALQKTAQERHALNGNSAVKIQQWVDQELEVLVAERTIKQLSEDSGLHSQRLKQLQSNLEDESLKPEDKEQIEVKIKQLNEDISLGNTEISVLRQKLTDADKENKAKHRWEPVQSMKDAKCALKYLLELVADTKTPKDLKFEEVQAAHSEELETSQKSEQQLKQLAQENQQEVKIKECELQTMENLRNEIEAKQAEIDMLKLQLNKPKRSRKTSIFEQEEWLESESCSEDSIDDPNDPDWVKTPLFKESRKLKKNNRRLGADKENITENEKGVKRSPHGAQICSCTGKCAKCSCKAIRVFCTSACRCSAVKCVNRDQNKNTERVLFPDDSSTEDDNSSKRPRLL